MHSIYLLINCGVSDSFLCLFFLLSVACRSVGIVTSTENSAMSMQVPPLITFPARSRWPCIFSLKCCLCDLEGTGLRADRWLRALGSCVNMKQVWWAPPSSAISRRANTLSEFLRIQNRYLHYVLLYVEAYPPFIHFWLIVLFKWEIAQTRMMWKM